MSGVDFANSIGLRIYLPRVSWAIRTHFIALHMDNNMVHNITMAPKWQSKLWAHFIVGVAQSDKMLKRRIEVNISFFNGSVKYNGKIRRKKNPKHVRFYFIVVNRAICLKYLFENSILEI